MRLVIKPLGLLVLLGCIGVLAALAYNNVKGGGGRAAIAPTTPPPLAAVPPPAAAPPAAPGTGGPDPALAALLGNPGFEEGPAPYQDAALRGEAAAGNSPNARVSGKVADGWIDNSQWGEAAIHYAPDPENPHEGKASQRIEVRELPADTSKGAAQFAKVMVPPRGGAFNFWLWLRASEEGVPVVLSVRAGGDDEGGAVKYGTAVAKVGREWKRVLVTARLPKEGESYRPGTVWLMLLIRQGGVTVWADDAGIQRLAEVAAD